MKLFKALFSIIVTLGLLLLLEINLGSIPYLGKFLGVTPAFGRFLSPESGFWQNAESKHVIANKELKIPGLQGKIIVKYDENMIPHIFAENDHDLYLAQGYITARDRLWQMDIQTRSASGRLAEVIGPKALDIDRYHRRMGMVYGAENTVRKMMSDPEMNQVLVAYTAGINAYIHQLWTRDYPIEFKLLNYDPVEWKPIDCAFLLKLMSETLAGGSDQFAMTNTLKLFGPAVTNDLFPDQEAHQQPIIPAGTKWNFTPVAIPKPSADFNALMTEHIKTAKRDPGIGSNNWAVSGSKTASGYPILANDPHLNLSLPSIWYQIQLTSPNVNVCGASLPGAPGVVSGFNNKISWGLTNVGADVLDWYQVRFKDASRNEYWYNNKWNKTNKRVEAIVVRGQPTVYDTVIYTHHGPVVYESAAKKPKDRYDEVPIGNAMRWVAHDESEDMKTFYLLNRGKNYADYRKALTYYSAPAQNFVFASADNDIAITPNGKFPLKYKDQGKFIMDGSDPANDWHGFIPMDQNPTVKNPQQGFVTSSNQTLTDATYPYYINWSFGAYDRGKRISDLLGAMKNITVDSMRLMQMDNYSTRAHDILPYVLKYLDASKMDPTQQAALTLLKNWDRHYAADSQGATIFDLWWSKFYSMTWDDELNAKGSILAEPSEDRTEQLLIKEPDSKWFDNVNTLNHETGAEIVSDAFTATVEQLVQKYGQPGVKWQWGKVKRTYVDNLARIPAFGSGDFVAGGNNGVINALRNGHGPSWRMVVQMGPKTKGYGVIPGGESGNPGSFHYDDMLPTWKAGKLNELLFLQSADEQSPRIKSILILKSK